MRLPKNRNDLRHFQPERAVGSGQCRAVAVPIFFSPLNRVRPDLDADAAQRRAVLCPANGARHPETAFANAADNWCAGNIIVGAAAHGWCGCQPLRVRGLDQI